MRGQREVRVDFNIREFTDPSSVAARVDPTLFEDKSEISQAIARARADAVKKNVARFYALVYQGIFGGEASLRDIQANGDYSPYRPDVIHRTRRGRIDVELKAFNMSQTAQVPCSAPQFENYMLKLATRVDTGSGRKQFDPDKVEFRYGFFRYSFPTKNLRIKGTYSNDRPKYRKTRRGESLGNLSRPEFIESFGDKTRDLLVVPSNLIFLMLNSAELYGYSRLNKNGNSNTKNYWRVRSKNITQLHYSDDGFKGVVEEQAREKYIPGVPFNGEKIGHFSSDDLVFGGLEKIQQESPRIILGGKYEVKPFPYTVYRFKSPQDARSWTQFVRKNHRSLLVDLLGVRDLYEEGKEIPI